MTPNEQKKLRSILDAIRFDGKPTEQAFVQIKQLFEREEMTIKNRREETRLFYVTFSIILVVISLTVLSCYHNV
jgi:hypothetical protein